jgi:hypothetical protein
MRTGHMPSITVSILRVGAGMRLFSTIPVKPTGMKVRALI